ncbi:unnamed protein product [Orchesella dallaii]|uniref:Uncharacterized protein n=1 Tax=Orchesella dallaii TaxID=48710 RepID=A0ABP1PPI5_9HEXA
MEERDKILFGCNVRAFALVVSFLNMFYGMLILGLGISCIWVMLVRASESYGGLIGIIVAPAFFLYGILFTSMTGRTFLFIAYHETDGKSLMKMLWTFATFKVITWAILVAVALEANWFKDPSALAWKLLYFEAVVTIIYILVVHLHSRNLLIKSNYFEERLSASSEA